jgi:hypothetical protein
LDFRKSKVKDHRSSERNGFFNEDSTGHSVAGAFFVKTGLMLGGKPATACPEHSLQPLPLKARRG